MNRSSSVDGISNVWLSLWLTEQKLKAIVMSAESSAVHRCLEFWTATVRFAWLVGQLILHQFGAKLNIACTRSVMKIVRSKVPVRVWIHEEKIIRTCSTFLVYREWTVLTCVVDVVVNTSPDFLCRRTFDCTLCSGGRMLSLYRANFRRHVYIIKNITANVAGFLLLDKQIKKFLAYFMHDSTW